MISRIVITALAIVIAAGLGTCVHAETVCTSRGAVVGAVVTAGTKQFHEAPHVTTLSGPAAAKVVAKAIEDGVIGVEGSTAVIFVIEDRSLVNFVIFAKGNCVKVVSYADTAALKGLLLEAQEGNA